MRSVVITGVPTGIGWATARFLLDPGFRVFGSVRKQADADRLTAEFGANFMPLIFDVTDEAAVFASARQVRDAPNGETLAGLVNNAGLPPAKIAEIIFNALTAPNPKVRYQIAPDRMQHIVASILPKRTLDRIIGKRLGLMPSP
ncbi:MULTISPECIES: SDR family NAD(P)-dependent oxidoreductase [Bradyrhizobium]|uniref:SDR family NAD(P)-dependent oxidoreductase n=1 Tax=Bradyrhizobium elkanii TaxID=29448 RepID=UPI0003FC9336|nr:SDR family NAD(P)-dependent oxidoreductase [Bradyrhizobium elkanii]